MSSTPDPLMPPSGDVFFPLASNAHALLAGGPVASVRARMKVSSLLYSRVLVEAGSMTIQAGPRGSSAWRHPSGAPGSRTWQTPLGRQRGQRAPISVAIATQTTPSVPAAGPYQQVLHSETSICWLPTLEPFQHELPPQCDWVVFGSPVGIAPQFKKLEEDWKRRDGGNEALTRLVPENFVRSRLINHVTHDLAVGASAGWDVSVDRRHGQVIGARFASDGLFNHRGLALPILVPQVGDLPWEDVVKIRRHKAINRLREVLREVENEAFEVTQAGGDLEAAMHRAYTKKVAGASEQARGIRSIAATNVAEVLLGLGLGYGTMGLSLLGPLVATGISMTVTTPLQVRKLVRERRQRAWIGVMDAIAGN